MMIRHFTVSLLIIHEGKILLVRHKKHGKWLQPGGHLEENEVPSEGALREALEETGLEIELISQENIMVDHSHAKTFPRPYTCLQEIIPARHGEPEHEHLDLVYLGRPKGADVTPRGEEQCCWFDEAELEELNRQEAIFPEVLDMFRSLK